MGFFSFPFSETETSHNCELPVGSKVGHNIRRQSLHGHTNEKGVISTNKKKILNL